jgi:predicted AAA+ superfamily ATPase
MAETTEEPSQRFARLEREIAQARRRLAGLRHEGERHFIDDQPVHPEVPGVLEDIVRRGDELDQLRQMSSGSHAVNRASTAAEADEQHRQLDVLEERIQRLSILLNDDPHKHERHFIDG